MSVSLIRDGIDALFDITDTLDTIVSIKLAS